MKKIKIKGASYSIPTAWEEITLEKQLEVERLAEANPNFKSLAVLAGYLGVDINTLKHLHINEVKSILSNIEFTKTPMPATPIEKFKLKGEEYTVLPSLLKAEFQDFISIETIIENNKKNVYKSLPYIIAVLAKKEGESLDSFDLDKRAEQFKQLPLTVAHSLYVFFCGVGLMYSTDSQKALQVVNQNLLESIGNMRNTVKEHRGGGISILWHKAKLLIYLKSLEQKWKRYYTGCTSQEKRTTWIQRFRRSLKKKLQTS